MEVETETVEQESFVSENLVNEIPTDMGSCSSNCSSDSMVSCRICKSSKGPDLVPSPCKCKGSMGTVHVSCLEEWLTGSTRDSCELCSTPFRVVRTRKYGLAQSLWLFLCNSVNLVKLLRDIFFLGVSIMNTSILFYMWVTYVFKDVFSVFGGKQMELEQVMIINPIRGILYFFFFTLCLVFVSVNAIDDIRRIFYYYFLPWYTWWQTAVDVKLLADLVNHEDKHKQQ